jgi:hypothetical protein
VSFILFLSLLIATFACVGVVLAIVMGRLGHSPFAWGLAGLVLGPIALLLALVAARDQQTWSRLVAAGVPGSGPVDVLVGIDGSPESAAATTAALGLLGNRVGRLTLVAVSEMDDSFAGREDQERLRHELERQAEAVRVWLREHDRGIRECSRSCLSWCCDRASPRRSWTGSPPRMATGCWWLAPGGPVCRASCLAALRPGWPLGPVCRCW